MSFSRFAYGAVAGRSVLVGDAAHPMTPNLGQGGCTALEVSCDRPRNADWCAVHSTVSRRINVCSRFSLADANWIQLRSMRLLLPPLHSL